MQCSELMKRRVKSIRPDLTLEAAARMMGVEGIGILPVCDADGRALGVLTDRDIAVRACGERLPADVTTVEAIMSRDLVTCRPEEELEAVEQRMFDHRKWRLLVVDDAGKLVGLLSLVDIAHQVGPFRTAVLLRQLADRDYRVEGPVPA